MENPQTKHIQFKLMCINLDQCTLKVNEMYFHLFSIQMNSHLNKSEVY